MNEYAMKFYLRAVFANAGFTLMGLEHEDFGPGEWRYLEHLQWREHEFGPMLEALRARRVPRFCSCGNQLDPGEAPYCGTCMTAERTVSRAELD